jgi:hypothetical protein
LEVGGRLVRRGVNSFWASSSSLCIFVNVPLFLKFKMLSQSFNWHIHGLENLSKRTKNKKDILNVQL